MKILITGGLGFVGNEVVRQLRLNYHLFIIDSENRKAPDIDDINDVVMYKIDIVDKEAVNRVFELVRPDFVIHLAAIHFIPECNENPGRTLRVNVEGTQNVLDASEFYKVKHLISISSGAVYSDSSEILNEANSSIGPVDIYGYSKWFSEKLCQQKFESTNLPITVVRLFNVYGPRETNPHIIPEIINQLKKSHILELGNIMPLRDFVSTKDVAYVLSKLISDIPEEGFRIVNLGTGQGFSIGQVIDIISDLLKIDIEVVINKDRFRISDKQTQICDTTYLKQILPEFEPIPFVDGLRDLLEYEGLLSIKK